MSKFIKRGGVVYQVTEAVTVTETVAAPEVLEHELRQINRQIRTLRDRQAAIKELLAAVAAAEAEGLEDLPEVVTAPVEEG